MKINKQSFKLWWRLNIWQEPSHKASFWRKRLVIFAQHVHLLLRDIKTGQLNLRAMSLVFTTVLGIIPIVALTFFVLSIVNAQDQLPQIIAFLTAPFGDTLATAIMEPTLEIVPQLNPKVLGTVGVIFLLYTALTLIQKIESAFNFIWHIPKSRGLIRRLGDYIVLMIAMGIAIGMFVSFTDAALQYPLLKQVLDNKDISSSLSFINRLTPAFILFASITIAYKIIPNTSVRISSAMIGAIFTTIILNMIGWVFGSFIATSSNYEAVYSGFAITVLMLISIHLMWFVVLFGASISYYSNNSRNRALQQTPLKLYGRMRERLGLTLVSLVGQAFSQSHANGVEAKNHWTLENLSAHLNLPEDTLEDIVQTLVEHSILDWRGETQDSLYPATSLEAVTVKQVLDAVRSDSESHTQYDIGRIEYNASHPEVDVIVGQIENKLSQLYSNMTVQQMINRATVHTTVNDH